MTTALSTIVELAAYAAFIAAGWLLTPVLGLAVLGGVLLLIAHVIDGTTIDLPTLAAVRTRALAAGRALLGIPERTGGQA